jgi:hypothetical protein
MKIRELLVEQMETSREFTKKNFGLAVGSAYPELVRECLADEKIALELFTSWVKVILLKPDSLFDEETMKSPSAMVNADPSLYDTGMKFFYWGIQIGRALEQEETKVLDRLAKEQE